MGAGTAASGAGRRASGCLSVPSLARRRANTRMPRCDRRAGAGARTDRLRTLAVRQRRAKAAEELRELDPELVFLLAGKAPEHILFEYEIKNIPAGRKPAADQRRAHTHDGVYLEQSPSKAGVKHLLPFYLRLAALLAGLGERAPGRPYCLPGHQIAGRPGRVQAQGRGPAAEARVRRAVVQRSRALLAELAGLYLAYRESGLPFHAEAGFEVFKKPDEDRLNLLEQYWMPRSSAVYCR